MFRHSLDFSPFSHQNSLKPNFQTPQITLRTVNAPRFRAIEIRLILASFSKIRPKKKRTLPLQTELHSWSFALIRTNTNIRYNTLKITLCVGHVKHLRLKYFNRRSCQVPDCLGVHVKFRLLSILGSVTSLTDSLSWREEEERLIRLLRFDLEWFFDSNLLESSVFQGVVFFL